jgi:hypothetical protein
MFDEEGLTYRYTTIIASSTNSDLSKTVQHLKRLNGLALRVLAILLVMLTFTLVHYQIGSYITSMCSLNP